MVATVKQHYSRWDRNVENVSSSHANSKVYDEKLLLFWHPDFFLARLFFFGGWNDLLKLRWKWWWVLQRGDRRGTYSRSAVPNLESKLPNFFLHKRNILPFFAIKLGHFIVNTFFHMLQTLMLNSRIRKRKKTKFGSDRLNFTLRYVTLR